MTNDSSWTEQQIPDQNGRVAVVTGANTGLGFETARMLAERDASVVMAVRDVEKGRQAADRIRGDVGVQELDLASLDSVRSAARELRALRAATDPLVTGGQYYGPGGLGEVRGYPRQVASSRYSHDLATQERLWMVSEELAA